jgi:hypothetical protein
MRSFTGVSQFQQKATIASDIAFIRGLASSVFARARARARRSFPEYQSL